MKVDSVVLKNWKSYDNDGIELSNFKKINIIVGPNNSGKSNFFKYFYHIREMLIESLSSDINLLNDYGVINEINASFSKENTWAWENSNIECIIKFNKQDCLDSDDISDYLKKSNFVEGRISHNQAESKSIFSIVDDKNNALLELDSGKKPRVYNETNYLDMREEFTQAFDTVHIWKNFMNSLVFIDPIRHIDRESILEEEECDFNGCNLKDEIVNLNCNRYEWVAFRTQLRSWLEKILDEKKFEPTITAEKKIAFTLKKGTTEIEAYFKDLGTGVSQLFMILSYLYINKEKKLNVFIEEPECNLHPEAVVRLIKILENEFTNHTFFITTHSSTLIDQLDDKWSINRMLKKENEASVVNPCNTIVDKYEILDELGIKASQLLQSNYIIWIEGPSDRTYINKWIKLFSESELVEGIHYSFLMYGGSNLSSYSLLDDDMYIDLLATSRYSTIVCDSDKSIDSAKLKKRVTKIIERVNELSKSQCGYIRKLDDYIKIWVTEGREIENYIGEEVFLSVLFTDGIKKCYFLKNDKTKDKLNYDNTIKNDYGKFMSFDKYFSERYTKVSGVQISDSEKQNISLHYSNKKVEIAKLISSKLDKKNSKVLDLNARIGELISHIELANNIK